METAVRDGRAIRDRLRIELESIAEAIAQVKTSLRNAATSGKPVNVNVLLTWLEVRVYSMRECLDPVTETAAAEPAAGPTSTPDVDPSQSDAVPTVSDVVSRLGRASNALAREADVLEQSTPATIHDVPTVSMLGAMVEALTAPDTTAAEGSEPGAVEAAEPAAMAGVAPAVSTSSVIEIEAVSHEAAVGTDTPMETSAQDTPAAETTDTVTEAVEPAGMDFELAPELLIAEAPEPQAIASDTTLEVTAFGSELGTPEPADTETDTASSEPSPAVEEVANSMESAPAAVIVEATHDIIIDAAPEQAAIPSTEQEPPTEPAVLHAAIEVTEEGAAVAPGASAEAIPETTVAVVISHYQENVQEIDLLSSFAAMEAMPFMHDEIGTAVIFEQRSDFDAAGEQVAFETAAKPGADAAAVPEAAAVQSESDTTAPAAANADAEPAVTGPAMDSEAAPEAAIAPPDEPIVETAAEPEPALDAALPADAPVEFASPMEAVAPAPVVAIAAQAEPILTARAQESAVAITGSLATYAGSSTLSIPLRAITATPAQGKLDNSMREAESAALAAAVPQLVHAKPASDIGLFAAQDATADVEATREDAVGDHEAATAPTAGHVDAATEASPSTKPNATAESQLNECGSVTATAAVDLSAAEAALALARVELAAAAVLLGSAPQNSAEERSTAVSVSAEATDDDLNDLFEPEPDVALDPNVVLLGPAPSPAFTLDPATAAVLPMHDMALSTSTKSAHVKEPAKPETAQSRTHHDPLAPLKALSDEEKIALFS